MSDWANQREYKITVLGGGGVGKSALTIRLVTNNFLEEYDPTFEDSYRKHVVIDEKSCLLDLLDTAGQEEFAAMQDQWIREGEAFIIVYPITSRSYFDEAIIVREKILRVKDDNPTFPIVLAGNKCDLEDQRQVQRSEGEELVKDWGKYSSFYETSAKNKINHEEIFYECVRMIRRREEQRDNTNDSNDIKKQAESCSASIKLCEWLKLISCCICIGILKLFTNMECCKTKEFLKKDIELSRRDKIEQQRRRQMQELAIYSRKKTDKLPIDKIPTPILSLKNFELKRKLHCKLFFMAILCGIFLPLVILIQTVAFLIFYCTQTFKLYPTYYPYEDAHYSILLDFLGVIIGREPFQDPETVKDRKWLLRQTKSQIFQRIIATVFILIAWSVCYYNALHFICSNGLIIHDNSIWISCNDKLSKMETIGPLSLFWILWIFVSFWIGYKPTIHPKLPHLTRLRAIKLFFGDDFTHFSDAYKFIRSYGASRDSKWKLSWYQVIIILLFALLYALVPLISHAIADDHDIGYFLTEFWISKNLSMQYGAIYSNWILIMIFICVIEIQYTRNFNHYREWMYDLTMLLSKDKNDENNINDDQDLIPEKGSNFSKELFLSLTRRSNALGWLEIRSYLAIEGQILLGQQELPTLLLTHMNNPLS
eukprot:43257_1